MRKKLFLLSSLLAPALLCAQNATVDSLQKKLHKAKTDTAKISIYIQMSAAAEDSTALSYCSRAEQLINVLMPNSSGKMKTALLNYLSDAEYYKGYCFFNLEEVDSSFAHYQKALALARQTGNKKQEALCYNDIAFYYYSNNDLKTALDYFEKSVALREELKDENDLQESYNNIAFISKLMGNIEKALDLHFKALALQEKLKQPEDIATSYNNIGQLYHYYLNDKPKALDYYTKSLELRKQSGNKKDIALMLNNIGSVISDTGNRTEAINIFKQSLALRKEVNYKYGVVEALNNIGYNFRMLHLYDSSFYYCYAGLQANEAIHNDYIAEAIYNNLAENHLAKNNIDSALYYGQKEYAINKAGGIPIDISVSAKLLSAVYEKKGDYKKALEYHREYAAMEDSIKNDDTKKAGIKNELQYQYLKEKAASDTLYEEQLARRNFITWLFAILLIAAGIIFYVLWNRYKLKQKLKEVQLRHKIASDLHDDVGATLSSIRLYSGIVNNQLKDTHPHSTELLNKISSNSKEMIENMSDIVWMIKPGNDAFENIENRMLNFANELCVPAGIAFECNVDAAIKELKISMEQRRDLYLIFKEAINNAVKYSACKTIRVNIALKNKDVQMDISDDGKGFNTADKSYGNGLLNMKKRAETNKGSFTLNTSPGQGTDLLVILPVT